MRHSILTPIVFLAALALAPTRAAADSPDREAPPDSFTLFGTTTCFSWAPADALCDYRLGEPANVKRVFGMTVCLGPVPTGVSCDVGPFASPASPDKVAQITPAEAGKILRVLGKTVCVGSVADSAACDVAIGSTRTATLESLRERM